MVEIEQIGTIPVACDTALAAEITDKLAKWYPGHLWGVLFNEDGGTVSIVCESVQHPLLTNRLYAYVLHLKTIYSDVDRKCVMRAGGEILERARLDRGAAKEGAFVTHVDGVKENHQPLIYGR